jgi:hypothetical protein
MFRPLSEVIIRYYKDETDKKNSYKYLVVLPNRIPWGNNKPIVQTQNRETNKQRAKRKKAKKNQEKQEKTNYKLKSTY